MIIRLVAMRSCLGAKPTPRTFMFMKKPDPVWGPVSVIVGVGADNIFQRGTCCTSAILGGYPSGVTASS